MGTRACPTARSPAPRLAAHAVGAPARSPRSLAARRRDRRHRPRPRPGAALERPDRWARTPSRSRSTRSSSMRSPAMTAPGLDAKGRLAVMLHDAPEYVIGDLISPFKALLGGEYRAIEARLLAAIHRRFGLPTPLPARLTAAIKAADRIAAYYEATRLAGFGEAEARQFFGRPERRRCRAASTSSRGRRAAAEKRFLDALRRRCSPQRARDPRPVPGLKSREKQHPESLMPQVYVCPLSRIADTVAALQCQPPHQPDQRRHAGRPAAAIPAENHLFLGINDIVEPMDGMVLPAEEHVERADRFRRRLGSGRARSSSTAIAGISRSTAAAFITLCARASRSATRARSPGGCAPPRASPTPNPRHRRASATSSSGAKGRMVAAIEGDRPRRDRRRERPLLARPRGVAATERRPAGRRSRSASTRRSSPSRDRQPLILVVASTAAVASPTACPSGRSTRSSTARSRRGSAPGSRSRRALKLGYVEQLYTFGDRGRHAAARRRRAASRLGRLPRADARSARSRRRRWPGPARAGGAGTSSSRGRTGAAAARRSSTTPSSRRCGAGRATAGERPRRAPLGRRERVRLAFGDEGAPWDEERVLDRYELLYEAGLVAEADRDGRPAPVERAAAGRGRRADALRSPPHPRHRDLAAPRQAQVPAGGVRADGAGIHADRAAAHGRGDLRPSPPQAEFPPPGRERRRWSSRPARESRPKRGRPAALFRFRREVLKERPAPGLRRRRRA